MRSDCHGMSLESPRRNGFTRGHGVLQAIQPRNPRERATSAYFIMPGRNECQRRLGRELGVVAGDAPVGEAVLGTGETMSVLPGATSTDSVRVADGQGTPDSPEALCTRSIAALAFAARSRRKLVSSRRWVMACVQGVFEGVPPGRVQAWRNVPGRSAELRNNPLRRRENDPFAILALRRLVMRFEPGQDRPRFPDRLAMIAKA